MSLPTFKYFEDPEHFSVFLEDETSCEICAETKRCFDASIYYGEDRIAAICPDCLASGVLQELDIFTCEGDIVELTRQLQAIYPQWSVAAVEKLARDKTAELEETTPKFISWQDWPWPCAEGDYCRFLGFGSQALYNRLAEGNDGVNLFHDSLYYSVKEAGDPDELWAESMPAKAIKDYEASQAFDLLFYVFKSLRSDTIVTIWDVA
jgi:uncharacterized protein CbrC (UPF0167 family)